jgi:MarR family transcriptional regulator, 2-MHQ and catechol-resistance regulon repressor
MLDVSSKTIAWYLRVQHLTPKTSEGAVEALGHLLGAHATLTRQLSAQLVEEHGLTMSEYEVLLLLAREPDQAMRRIDLSREVRLSPSGITRMLDRLEDTGLVEKGACASDARVSYAVLTETGMRKLRECAPAHFAAVERLIGDRLSDDEIESLSKLLGRLSDLDDDCSVGD